MYGQVAVPLLLVLGALVVGGAARRFGLSSPLVLVVAGLAVSFIPGVPDFRLNPTVALYLFLPPLLFSAGLDSSFVSLRRNIRPVVLLSVGLVLVTLVVVGWTAYAVLPELSLPAAFTLGAIVAPPDAVAATSIGRGLGLPRRLVVLLGGESLFNDATALTSYKLAVSAATGMGFSYLTGGLELLWATAVGISYGLLVGVLVVRLTRLLREPVLENSLWLATPFIAYLPAELAHGSGVLAVVVAGVYLGYNQTQATFASRLQAGSVWRMVNFVLESVVFALIGLQLRTVLRGLAGRDQVQLAVAAVVVLLAVLAVRFVYIFPAVFLGRLLRRAEVGHDVWKPTMVLSWAGMRGVVSLAAAEALPGDFPQRNLVVFLAFVVTVGTLLIQGSTLAPLIRLLGVGRDGPSQEDTLAEAAAQHAAAQAAVDRLDEHLADESTPGAPDDVVQRLRDRAQARQLGAWERLGGAPGRGYDETPSATYRRLRRSMLDAERDTFVRLRNEGRLDDEVFRTVQLELDLEEAMLSRE